MKGNISNYSQEFSQANKSAYLKEKPSPYIASDKFFEIQFVSKIESEFPGLAVSKNSKQFANKKETKTASSRGNVKQLVIPLGASILYLLRMVAEEVHPCCYNKAKR